jgi:hypothetical protein
MTISRFLGATVLLICVGSLHPLSSSAQTINPNKKYGCAPTLGKSCDTNETWPSPTAPLSPGSSICTFSAGVLLNHFGGMCSMRIASDRKHIEVMCRAAPLQPTTPPGNQYYRQLDQVTLVGGSDFSHCQLVEVWSLQSKKQKLVKKSNDPYCPGGTGSCGQFNQSTQQNCASTEVPCGDGNGNTTCVVASKCGDPQKPANQLLPK